MNDIKINTGTAIKLAVLSLIIINLYWAFPIFIDSGKERFPSYDSVFFTSIAYNILNFGDLGWVAYHEPFFYPLTTAFFSLFTTDDLLMASIIVSQVSRILLVLVTFLLADRVYGRVAGFCAAFFVSFMPHIVAIGGRPESEALYSLLITLSVYLLWRTKDKRTVLYGALSGLSFATAYFTRSEGLIILVFLLAALIVMEARRKRIDRRLAISLLTLLIVFSAVISPYMLFLKNHYGTWVFGSKTSGIYFWIRNKDFNDPDPVRAEWGLSPKGEINLISMTSRDVINYWLKDPAKSIQVYLKNLKGEIPGFIPNEGGMLHYPQVYPVYFALPLLLGLMNKLRRGRVMEGDYYLLSVFLVMLVYPLLTGGWWRYLVNYFPILAILTASGLSEINEEALNRIKSGSRWKKSLDSKLILWLFVLVVSAYHAWVLTEKKVPEDVKSYREKKNAYSLEAKKAGEWARKRFPPKSNYMAQWTRLPYYLGGRWTAMPETSYEGIVWYARKNRVDYLVFETSGRGESENIIRGMGDSPDLTVADVYESATTGYSVVFLRLNK